MTSSMVVAVPDCVVCRRQVCADWRTCQGELAGLLERTAPGSQGRGVRSAERELAADLDRALRAAMSGSAA